MTPSPMKDDTLNCWKSIGISGNRSCDQLRTHIHCRNCPVYRQAGRQLLNRPLPDDYVAELTRKLADKPPEQVEENARLVVFRIGALWFALPAEDFEETFLPGPIIKVPSRNHRAFLGLVVLNGDLQLCFTLRHWLTSDEEADRPEPASDETSRLMMLRSRSEHWVFQSDEVMGVVDFPRHDFQPLPPNLALSPRHQVKALFELDERSIKLLDTDPLISLFREALT